MAELIPWISPLLAAWAGVSRVEARRARREDGPRSGPDRSKPDQSEPDQSGPDPEEAFELGRTAFAAEPVDVEAALHVVFQDVARDVARHRSRIRVAASPDLLVHADRRALRHALTEMVRISLRLSPCAAVLVTARRHGGRIEVSCLADGPPETGMDLRAALRGAETVFALHGATMEIDPRLDGAVMRVRLPEYVERPPAPTIAAPSATAVEPTKAATPTLRPIRQTAE
jgi:hypothetical protein